MEKIKKKKKVLKTYIYINSTLVAQLWDAGDISNCQLLLVRLRQQGEPERERLQGWRREADFCRSGGAAS